MWNNPWRGKSVWPGGKPPPLERSSFAPAPPAGPTDATPLPAIPGTLAEQRAALEGVMRTNRRLWDASPDMQVKYRQVVDAERTGQPLPIAKPDPVAAEIAGIEARLHTNRRAYDRDPALQQRYRDLLKAKHGS